MPSPSSASLEQPYFGPTRLVIAIDLGQSFSSVHLSLLSFSAIPSSSLRAIAFPSPSPFSLASSTTPTATTTRFPSVIYYDEAEIPRAFGAECEMREVRERAGEEGWREVRGWKGQMTRMGPGVEDGDDVEAERGGKETRRGTSPSAGEDDSSFTSSSGDGASHSKKLLGMLRSRQPAASSPSSSKSKKNQEKKKATAKVESGPLLSTIYADFLKHLVAWFVSFSLQLLLPPCSVLLSLNLLTALLRSPQRPRPILRLAPP